jgi:Ca2+-binding RTX toxin-like protein
MSGSTWNASYWFFDSGFDGATYTGALLMGGPAGPDSVTVNWGTTGPNGANPLVETFSPEPDGQFYMPSTNSLRLFADGTFTTRVTATFEDGSTDVELMDLFIDLNGTGAVRRGGGSRDDLMAGGAGADSFSGRTGDDMLFGGLGSDRLDGNDGDDTLYGGEGADSLFGAADEDKAYGGEGDDRLSGGANDDLLLGEEGADTLSGDAGDDEMSGGDGNDRLTGGTGEDRYEGGLGADTLVSQADGEVDRFVFAGRTLGADRIVGFETGTDRIELGFLDGDAMSPARLVRSLADMTDTGPYLIYTPGGTLYADINGTAANGRTTIATLGNGTELAFGDFVFG